MSEKLIKLIMKYPFQFIATGVVLLLLYPLAIWALNYQRVIVLGWAAIIVMGILFGLFSVLFWWFISYTICDILYKKVTDNKIEYREYLKSWHVSILFGSIGSGLWAGVLLVFCYILSLSFKTFFFLNIFIAILRLSYYLFFERKYYANKNVGNLID